MGNLLAWALVKSGCKKMGNYIMVNGKYTHKDKIMMDFLSGLFLIVFGLVSMAIIYMLLWIAY